MHIFIKLIFIDFGVLIAVNCILLSKIIYNDPIVFLISYDEYLILFTYEYHFFWIPYDLHRFSNTTIYIRHGQYVMVHRPSKYLNNPKEDADEGSRQNSLKFFCIVSYWVVMTWNLNTY